MVKHKKQIKNKESKTFWSKMSAWLKGGIIGAVVGLLIALPTVLLNIKVNTPEFLLGISNYIYLPVVWCFYNCIFIPLTKLGVNFTMTGLLYAILVFGIVFYFLIGALIGWLTKKIIEKRREVIKK